MSAGVGLVLVLIVVLGATLQGSIGFGMGMVATPIIALVAPQLLPVTILLLATTLSAFGVVADRRGVNVPDLAVATVGRIPGTLLGAWLVSRLAAREFALLVAASILLGAALAARGLRPANRPRNVVIAATVSGVMGTATSVGGPPMALVWGGQEGRRMRGTLAAYFLLGSLMSFASLAAFGAVRREQIEAAAWLLPALLVGFVSARFAVRRLDVERTRRVALVSSVIGALLVLVTNL